MVEPLSIAASAASLVFRSIKIAKAISDFRSAYGKAPLVFVSISVECTIISATLSRVQHLALAEPANLAARFEGEAHLSEVFANVLESLARVYSILEDDLSKMSEKDKLKIVWNEKSLEKKLGLIRGQELAVVTLLTIMQSETMGEIRKFLVANKGGIEALAEETSILMEETASMRGFVSSTTPDENDKLLWDADVSDTASIMSMAGFGEITKQSAVYQRAALRRGGAASLLTVPEERSRGDAFKEQAVTELPEVPKTFEEQAREDAEAKAFRLAMSGKGDEIDTAFVFHRNYLQATGALLDKMNAAFAAAQREYDTGKEALIESRNANMQMLAKKTAETLADTDQNSVNASKLREELQRIVEYLKEYGINVTDSSVPPPTNDVP